MYLSLRVKIEMAILDEKGGRIPRPQDDTMI
jgi:hypothetical protein